MVYILCIGFSVCACRCYTREYINSSIYLTYKVCYQLLRNIYNITKFSTFFLQLSNFSPVKCLYAYPLSSTTSITPQLIPLSKDFTFVNSCSVSGSAPSAPFFLNEGEPHFNCALHSALYFASDFACDPKGFALYPFHSN